MSSDYLPGHEVRELTGNGLVPAKQDKAMASSFRMKRLVKNKTGAYSLGTPNNQLDDETLSLKCHVIHSIRFVLHSSRVPQNSTKKS